MRHQGRWRLKWNGKRVRFVTRDALNWTQEEIAWRQEQMCDAAKVDVRATQVVTGIQLAERRAQNVKVMWNMCPLRANLVHWRRCRRPARSGVLTFLHKTSREFCKMCDANVELECRCVSLFAEGAATSTLAEMFSIEISQAP